MTKDILVIYHGDCLDGFCAAWQAWRKFGDTAEYYPGLYGKEPPDVTGKEVYIVDFSYKYKPTMDMIAVAKSYVVLDHHVSAERELNLVHYEPEQNVSIIFDMNRSGAGLARDYFQPGLDCWIVDYTQDRDLWKFELPDSKVINSYLATLDYDFEAYERTFQTISREEAVVLGAGADAYKNMYVARMRAHARKMNFAGYDNIPVVNAPFVGTSELVGALAEDALFAVGWYQRVDGKVIYSLRSKHGFDVSALAQQFGGGGHAAAAGFQVNGIDNLVQKD